LALRPEVSWSTLAFDFIVEGSTLSFHPHSRRVNPQLSLIVEGLTFFLYIVIVIAHANRRERKMDYLLALDRAVFLWINNQLANPYPFPVTPQS
jgi:hypothetical protein